MHDKKLLALIVLVIILNHTADHIARGDLTWPLTAPSLPSVIITLAIYAVLGLSPPEKPPSSYCYYSEKADDTIEVRTDLATNGTMLNNLKPRPGMDLIGAYNNCIWNIRRHEYDVRFVPKADIGDSL